MARSLCHGAGSENHPVLLAAERGNGGRKQEYRQGADGHCLGVRHVHGEIAWMNGTDDAMSTPH